MTVPLQGLRLALRSDLAAQMSRWYLIATFCVAGAAKIVWPPQAPRELVTLAHDLGLPLAAVDTFWSSLPYVEVIVACLLLRPSRLALSAVAVLLTGFTLWLGLIGLSAEPGSFDCGCFGAGGPDVLAGYTVSVVRMALLWTALIILARRLGPSQNHPSSHGCGAGGQHPRHQYGHGA